MAFRKKTKEQKEAEIKTLLENADKEIEKFFDTPEAIKEYLSFMSRFYNYSYNNSILIQRQFKGAQAVGSYAFWKEKGFTINKDEKGIKILVPYKSKPRFKDENGEIKTIDEANEKEKKLIKDGVLEVCDSRIYFSQGYVFDVSQTDAKAEDLPKIFPNRWLEGDVKNYGILVDGMKKIADSIGVRIISPKDELGAVKGVSYTSTKEVALNTRNSELQNVKTLLHELTHAKLHDIKNNDKYTTNEKEFQAELTAYTVCSYFGLDTSEYSFRYIKSWTKDVDLNDKKKLLKEVHDTAAEYVNILESELLKNEIKEKGVENSMDNENSIKEKDVRTIIKEHEEWIASSGKRGKKLDLKGKNLRGIKLLNLDLRNANLKDADLRGCIIYADLRNANLMGTKIDNSTKFTGSNLSNTYIEANKLDLIRHQIAEDEGKHKNALKSLKTNKNKEKVRVIEN